MCLFNISFIGIYRSRETIDLYPLYSVCCGLWMPIWEWQSLPHSEHMTAIAGLLARHTVFLWSLFSSTFIRCVSSYCDSCSFTVGLQASLSVAGTSQEFMFMPSTWLACICPWSIVWGHPVGLFSICLSKWLCNRHKVACLAPMCSTRSRLTKGCIIWL